ncbi:hypothetical protein OS493_032818 [Desmophyllum pertusum]|uniref:Uncharacterized protein n=1 Tax=Desmophyllum pertusum TaxID=174260 RepID=A0A9W9Z995_9CNID|nr:hypothetical protein OS493_032818 [Desmophyllum pertusum]
MDEESATALFTYLRSLSKLEVLDVSHNPLGSAVIVIAEHLDSAPCLAVLNMTDVKMGDHEVTALASSLKNLPNLWFLSLGPIHLAGECVHVKHLSKIPKLKRLDLASVHMGDKEINSVSKACKITRRFHHHHRLSYYGANDEENDGDQIYEEQDYGANYEENDGDQIYEEQDYGANDEETMGTRFMKSRTMAPMMKKTMGPDL